MKKIVTAFVAIAALLLGGCASTGFVPNTGTNYRGPEAREVQRVTLGKVVDIRVVQIVNDEGRTGSLAGAGLGGVLGAVAGKHVGGGSGTRAAQAVLGILGAVGGSAIGRQADRVTEEAAEIVVELADKRLVAVTQAIDADVTQMRAGDIVRLTGNGDKVRVARHFAPAAAPVAKAGKVPTKALAF